MVQLVYRLKANIKLLKRLIISNWQYETAYFTSNIFATLSPVVYTLSFLLFISVVFQNVSSIAGYSKDEMLFLFFVGQLSFYSFSFWSEGGVIIEKYVNNGNLDYILTRPVSSIFFVTMHKIMPLDRKSPTSWLGCFCGIFSEHPFRGLKQWIKSLVLGSIPCFSKYSSGLGYVG
jgi:hypothetical protein